MGWSSRAGGHVLLCFFFCLLFSFLALFLGEYSAPVSWPKLWAGPIVTVRCDVWKLSDQRIMSPLMYSPCPRLSSPPPNLKLGEKRPGQERDGEACQIAGAHDGEAAHRLRRRCLLGNLLRSQFLLQIPSLTGCNFPIDQRQLLPPAFHGCSTPVRRPSLAVDCISFHDTKGTKCIIKADVAKKLVGHSKKQRRLQQKRRRCRHGPQLAMNGRSKNIFQF